MTITRIMSWTPFAAVDAADRERSVRNGLRSVDIQWNIPISYSSLTNRVMQASTPNR